MEHDETIDCSGVQCGVRFPGLTACSTESASEHETKDVRANIRVLTSGTGANATTVSVNLYPPDGITKFLQLTADDALEATVGSTTKKLDEESLAGVVSYSAGFDEAAAGTTVKVALKRTIDDGAPNSTVTLPSEFTLLPLADERASRAQDLVVAWTSPDATEGTTVSVEGECLESLTREVPAQESSVTIAAGELKKRETAPNGTPAPDECTANVRVYRTRAGQADPAFKNGTVVAEREERLTFTSTL